MKKVLTHVIAPEGCEMYLTPGKKYPVTKVCVYESSDHGAFFNVTSDLGIEGRFKLNGCLHLNGKNWIPVYEYPLRTKLACTAIILVLIGSIVFLVAKSCSESAGKPSFAKSRHIETEYKLVEELSGLRVM